MSHCPLLSSCLPDEHPPDLRALFQVLPGDLPLPLVEELVVEGLWIMVIKQDESLPGPNLTSIE
nr:hypothetical protein [Candidatus Methylacidithermus pantelleriae]